MTRRTSIAFCQSARAYRFQGGFAPIAGKPCSYKALRFTRAAISSIDTQEFYLADKIGTQAASKHFGEPEDKIEHRLNDQPESGQPCLQAAELGITQYRELSYNPYRVI